MRLLGRRPRQCLRNQAYMKSKKRGEKENKDSGGIPDRIGVKSRVGQEMSGDRRPSWAGRKGGGPKPQDEAVDIGGSTES